MTENDGNIVENDAKVIEKMMENDEELLYAQRNWGTEAIKTARFDKNTKWIWRTKKVGTWIQESNIPSGKLT